MSFAFTLKSYFFEKLSNENIMIRYAKTGEQKLLSQLYAANGDDLYHFVITLSDPTLAKDICQKTWLKVMEKKHLYQNAGQFKAWLFTLARNQLIDEYRAERLITNTPDKLAYEGKKYRDNVPDKNVQVCFNEALVTLPFEQREAFCLQQEGFSLEDIASITHCGLETVKSRLRYAKKHLRTQLKGHKEGNHG